MKWADGTSSTSDPKGITRTAVIILNWNRRGMTAACLDSLKKVTYPCFQVYVVDNGSDEDPAGYFRERHPDIVYVRNETNLGFSGGNNVGIRAAMHGNYEYILLLNDDTLVGPAFLDHLIREVERCPGTGLANPKIYYHEDPRRLWYAGGKTSFFRGAVHFGRDQIDRGQFDAVREVSFVTGCALLVKREVIERIGLLDEELFLYAEDLDWCLRARKAGYKALYVPAAEVRHRIPVDAPEDTLRKYHGYRGLTRVFRRHFSKIGFGCFFLYFLLLWGPYKTIRYLLKGRGDVAVSIWKGFFHHRSP